jgi:membrane-associated phospholipid phosphatase
LRLQVLARRYVVAGLASDFDTRRRQLLAFIVVASAIALVVLYLVAVRTRFGQEFDDVAYDGRKIVDPQVTRATNDLLHSVTRSSLFLLTGAVVAFALARRRIRLAFVAGATVTACVVVSEVLKSHVLDRPQLSGIKGITFNSFPSGHATIGMALSLAVVMVSPHRWRWLAAMGAVALTLTFGAGVVATGWHRPSDVLAAYLVCAGGFATGTLLLIRWRGSGDDASRDFGEVEEHLTGWVVALAGLLIAAAAAVAGWLTLQRDGLHTVEFAAQYVAVAAVILALGIAVVIGYHQLLRGVSLDAPRHPFDEPGPDPGAIAPGSGPRTGRLPRTGN